MFDSVTPWTAVHQAPLSMECSSQEYWSGKKKKEYWSGLPFPPPGDLSISGIEPVFPALAGGIFTTEPRRKPPAVNYLYVI